MATINVNAVSPASRYASQARACGPDCRCAACQRATQNAAAGLSGEANPHAQTTGAQGQADARSTLGRATAVKEQPLSDEALAVLRELKAIDAAVRLHEQAHLAIAGELAQGGASFTFKTGPDGRQYAVGGEVQIDSSPGRTPEETLRKAQIIRAAALAPAQPSAQDLAVAASVVSMEQDARAEIAQRSAMAQKLARSYGASDQPGRAFAAQA